MTQDVASEFIPAPRIIAKDLIRLSGWYEEHRPEQREITLSQAAWERLRRADPRTLRHHQIKRSDEGLTYKGFTLRCKGRPKGGGVRPSRSKRPEAAQAASAG